MYRCAAYVPLYPRPSSVCLSVCHDEVAPIQEMSELLSQRSWLYMDTANQLVHLSRGVLTKAWWVSGTLPLLPWGHEVWAACALSV